MTKPTITDPTARPMLKDLRPLGVEGPDRAVMETAVRSVAENGLRTGPLTSLLGELASASPFLARAIGAQRDWLAANAHSRPSEVMSEVIGALDAVAPSASEAEAMTALRETRERALLLIALADCGGAWDVEATTRALSDHADASCRAAWGWGVAEAVRRRRLPAEAEARGEGFLLALGKGGARELNYSSDIDVVAFYARPSAPGTRDLTAGWVAVGRSVTRLLGARYDGRIAHRVDWRLRPDPGATPLAVSTVAAVNYYQSQARSWERLAWIKARPVAGDIEAGEAFLGEIEPFVWRRTLDFGVARETARLADRIRAAKGQGEDVSGENVATLDGWDVKTGRGGIREVEFIVQSQQTIRGGRDPALRARATLDALRALVGVGAVDEPDAAALASAYRHHRTLEHRIQMVADEQTQTFPPPGEPRVRVAALMGTDVAGMESAALDHRARVAALFDTLVDAPDAGNEDDTRARAALDALDAPDGAGTSEDAGQGVGEAAAGALAAFGLDAAVTAPILRGWVAARPPALRSREAREALDAVLPRLVAALAATRDPTGALAALDRAVARVPSGLGLFSLLRARPALCSLFARVAADAPGLIEAAARDPAMLADAAEASFWTSPSWGETDAAMAGLERRGGGLEAAMDAVRIVHRSAMFRLALRLMEGLDAATAGADASAVVEVGIARLWRAAHRERGLDPASSGLAVMAMGRLGGREATIASDLDLIVVARDAAAAEAGTRAVRDFLAAVSSPTGEGRFREVDMRLRPSGRAGPLVTTMPGFVRHHEAPEAWELIALGRARPICGDGAVMDGLADALAAIRTRERDRAALREGAADVLRRVRAERPALGPLDVKNRAGGLFDIEYAVHLAHVLHPELGRGAETRTAPLIEALGGALDARTVQALASVHADLSRVLHLRAAVGEGAASPPSAALDDAFEGDAAAAVERLCERGVAGVAVLWQWLADDRE